MVEEPSFFYMDINKNWDLFHNYELSNIAKRIKRKIVILTTNNNYKTNEYVKIIKIKEQNWDRVDWWEYIKNKHNKELKMSLMWLNK